MSLATGLLLAGGWGAFTPEGTAATAPLIARGVVALGVPADCAHPWGAWAQAVLGLVDARRFDDCAALVGGGWRRRTALVRYALVPGAAPVPRANAARLLLLGAVDDEALAAEVLLTPPNDPVPLVDEAVFTHAPADLGALAETAPVRGLYDRAVLLRDADPGAALAVLGPLAAELPPDEQRRLRPEPAAPGGLPGSDLEPAPPADTPPPAPEGVLAAVDERARDHVAAEWTRLVRFVKAGPGPAAAVDAPARWALALTSRDGAPRASVHAVLRGDPASPDVGAWVGAELAAAAGLTAEVRPFAGGYRLTVGAEVVSVGRCGGRWRGAVGAAPAPPVDATRLRDDATAALVAGLLREGRAVEARELALAAGLTPGPALAAALALGDAAPAPPGTPAPAPALLHPPRASGRRRLGAGAAPPPPPPPAFAYAAPTAPEDRALAAWWAAKAGAAEEARRLAGVAVGGAYEAVRVAALAAVGEPGAPAVALPDASCLPDTLPWPPAGG